MNGHLQQLQELTPANVGCNKSSSSASTNNNSIKQCSACSRHITDKFLLHAMERYWHSACLKCSCCQAQLGDIGQTCFTKGGMILCKNDYVR